ncbi:YdcF family protein [Larkinella soli]|uniref:YdcF family protein n=1 Tax=Larkinella soli TaxID=1770527 RepID=UPI000FFBFCBC|nr:YdcF family protein [Larkinella soli]
MFYFLSKVLSFLVMPMGILAFTLLIALFTKNHARRRAALIAALGWLWIGGNGFLTNELALWWEYPPATLPASPAPRVGVVLTGGMIDVDAEPKNRIYLGDQADRLGQALVLYKAGQIQKILISGGIGTIFVRNVADEGTMVERFLRLAGVPAKDILREPKSRNTHENALYSAPLLRRHLKGYTNVLITSAWHMRRAVGCFEKQGIRVVPYPAAFLSESRQYAPNHLLLPTEKAFYNFYWLVHEWVGYLAYWGAGYV